MKCIVCFSDVPTMTPDTTCPSSFPSGLFHRDYTISGKHYGIFGDPGDDSWYATYDDARSSCPPG